jgi:hypothetical protein
VTRGDRSSGAGPDQLGSGVAGLQLRPVHVEHINEGKRQAGREAEGLDPGDRLHEDGAVAQQLAQDQEGHGHAGAGGEDQVGPVVEQNTP